MKKKCDNKQVAKEPKPGVMLGYREFSRMYMKVDKIWRGNSNAAMWISVRAVKAALWSKPEEPDCEIGDVGFLGRWNRSSDG